MQKNSQLSCVLLKLFVKVKKPDEISQKTKKKLLNEVSALFESVFPINYIHSLRQLMRNWWNCVRCRNAFRCNCKVNRTVCIAHKHHFFLNEMWLYVWLDGHWAKLDNNLLVQGNIRYLNRKKQIERTNGRRVSEQSCRKVDAAYSAKAIPFSWF